MPDETRILDARLRTMEVGSSVTAAAYGPCEIEGAGTITHLEQPAREGEVGEATVLWESVGEELHVAIPDGGSLVADALELKAA